MDLSTRLNKIRTRFNLYEVFYPGLYYRFSNVKRIHLDNISYSEIPKFIHQLNYLKDFISELIDADFFDVCLMENFYEPSSSFSTDALEYLHSLDIQYSKQDHLYCSEFIEDDDNYAVYLFFTEEKNNLVKYLWGILARQFSYIEPHLELDVFFISGNKIIHVYDDRGFDICTLD